MQFLCISRKWSSRWPTWSLSLSRWWREGNGAGVPQTDFEDASKAWSPSESTVWSGNLEIKLWVSWCHFWRNENTEKWSRKNAGISTGRSSSCRSGWRTSWWSGMLRWMCCWIIGISCMVSSNRVPVHSKTRTQTLSAKSSSWSIKKSSGTCCWLTWTSAGNCIPSPSSNGVSSFHLGTSTPTTPMSSSWAESTIS